MITMSETQVSIEKIRFTDSSFPVTLIDQRSDHLEHAKFLRHHPEAEIHLVKQGSGAYLISGVRCPFKHHTLIVIQPNEVHRLITSDGVVGRTTVMFSDIWLRMDRSERRRFAELPRTIALTEVEAATMDQILHRMDAEIHGNERDRPRMVRYLLLEWLVLIDRAGAHVEATPATPHPILPEIVAFINAGYNKALSLPLLAERSGYSARHLSTLFKQHTGLSIKQYILQRRIAAARQILETDPAFSVSAIAERVGFSNFSLFNRAFKTINQATPSQYRAITAARQTHQ